MKTSHVLVDGVVIFYITFVDYFDKSSGLSRQIFVQQQTVLTRQDDYGEVKRFSGERGGDLARPSCMYGSTARSH